MEYIIALDQGTSSTRAILYTKDGQRLKVSQLPITQSYPEPGWVEHCPEEIWEKTLRVLRNVVAGKKVQNIRACGITNQRETTVIWHKDTGECLAPAIVWQDRRTEKFCASLADVSTEINHKTGLFPNPYFSASKINWLLQNNKKAALLAKKGKLAFGTIDSFLIWRLTGGKVHATDITNASRTLLFNIHSQKWDEDLLELFGIPKSILPEVKACDDYFGDVDKSIIDLAFPITGVAGDQHAALVGQNCLQTSMVKATFGTGGFLLLNTGKKALTSRHKLLTTIGYKIKNEVAYGLEGSLYQAGTVVRWLKDELNIIKKASDTETFARTLTDNDGVYIIPSFTGLGAPYWLNVTGGLITGLSLNSNRAHIARAALESVCYQTRDVLVAMQEDLHTDIKTLRVDGGMTVNNWFLDFLALQTGALIQRPKDVETTAKGAALLGALGAGLISDLYGLDAYWHMDRDFQNEENQNQREINYTGWTKAIRMLNQA